MQLAQNTVLKNVVFSSIGFCQNVLRLIDNVPMVIFSDYVFIVIISLYDIFFKYESSEFQNTPVA